jgi:hypothetical protein
MRRWIAGPISGRLLRWRIRPCSVVPRRLSHVFSMPDPPCFRPGRGGSVRAAVLLPAPSVPQPDAQSPPE